MSGERKELSCPICGVDPAQESCAADEGYGCPWWEDYKDEQSEALAKEFAQ